MAKAFSRRWHNRLSIFFALPLFLVGLTAILLGHAKALGLRQVNVPGMSMSREVELRSALPTADGWLLASRGGLLHYRDGRLESVSPFAGIEVRRLVDVQGRIYALTRKGIYREIDAGWQHVLEGDAWDLVSSGPGQLTAVLAPNRMLESSDGGEHWEQPARLGPLAEALHAGRQAMPMSIAQFAMAIHTGELLLGQAEWLWIDSVAALLVFLSLTGFWMWRQERQRRAQAAQRRPVGAAPENA